MTLRFSAREASVRSALLIAVILISQNALGACSRAEVAGPWAGTGVVTMAATGQRIPFSFTDEFHVTSTELKGHMVFEAAGPVPVPPLIDQVLSEAYTVVFGKGEDVRFLSNWGRGKGTWGLERYQLVVNDFTRAVHVVETGSILACDQMTVHGDISVLGARLATMEVDYRRP